MLFHAQDIQDVRAPVDLGLWCLLDDLNWDRRVSGGERGGRSQIAPQHCGSSELILTEDVHSVKTQSLILLLFVRCHVPHKTSVSTDHAKTGCKPHLRLD